MAQIFVHGDSLQVGNYCETWAAPKVVVLSQNLTVSSLVNFMWLRFLHCILQSCLVGIVVPDPDLLPMWIKKKGIEGTYSELCNNKVTFLTIRSPDYLHCLLCILTFFCFLGCEERHSGGRPETGQGSRTQVFWAGTRFSPVFSSTIIWVSKKRMNSSVLAAADDSFWPCPLFFPLHRWEILHYTQSCFLSRTAFWHPPWRPRGLSFGAVSESKLMNSMPKWKHKQTRSAVGMVIEAATYFEGEYRWFFFDNLHSVWDLFSNKLGK